MNIPFIKKADIVLAAVLLVLGFGSMAFVGGHKTGSNAEIIIDGKTVKTLPLSKNAEYELKTEHGFNRIVVRNGSVRVEDSDCHGRDCIGFGAISSEGQVIVCLPHKLLVKIGGGGDIDASI